ncbi:hypothetical protein S1OALGB6SA_711 [Olavius algarvensis spirochete endosymbiont]|nr:MAG: hypothetical protein [Olavius algarvensis spirochete endosymbiont]VDA99640.1 hypothetical protein S1OALGB6SA_711 [Olavius algarvensis spirochete endosymbiont]
MNHLPTAESRIRYISSWLDAAEMVFTMIFLQIHMRLYASIKAGLPGRCSLLGAWLVIGMYRLRVKGGLFWLQDEVRCNR